MQHDRCSFRTTPLHKARSIVTMWVVSYEGLSRLLLCCVKRPEGVGPQFFVFLSTSLFAACFVSYANISLASTSNGMPLRVGAKDILSPPQLTNDDN